MIMGKVPPNHWYGFRVRRTLEDPDTWYPANVYAGKLLLVCGLVVLVATLILPRLMPDLTSDNLAILMSVVLLGGVLVMVLLSWRYIIGLLTL